MEVVSVPRTKKAKSNWEDELDESIYSEEARERLLENDELTPLEEAFMMGWEDADNEDEE